MWLSPQGAVVLLVAFAFTLVVFGWLGLIVVRHLCWHPSLTGQRAKKMHDQADDE